MNGKNGEHSNIEHVSGKILLLNERSINLFKMSLNFFVLPCVSLSLGQIVFRLIILLAVEGNFEDKFSAGLKNQDLKTKCKWLSTL